MILKTIRILILLFSLWLIYHNITTKYSEVTTFSLALLTGVGITIYLGNKI